MCFRYILILRFSSILYHTQGTYLKVPYCSFYHDLYTIPHPSRKNVYAPGKQ